MQYLGMCRPFRYGLYFEIKGLIRLRQRWVDRMGGCDLRDRVQDWHLQPAQPEAKEFVL